MTIDVYADLEAVVLARTIESPVEHPLVDRTITVAEGWWNILPHR